MASFCSKKSMFKLLILLVLSSFIGNFIVHNLSGIFDHVSMPAEMNDMRRSDPTEMNDILSLVPSPSLGNKAWNETLNELCFIYLNNLSQSSASASRFMMILPHSISEEKALLENDKRALGELHQFLESNEVFDGATCLQQSATDIDSENEEDVKQAGDISPEASWCRFMQTNWSVSIRNSGPLEIVKPTDVEAPVLIQTCNIAQGPFVIRRDAFKRIGGLLGGFGKITLLEFFLRSKGELKIAKLTTCAWTHEITRADRGTLEGSATFPEYSKLGNRHLILRIVTENRIEWTACVANWKLCPEKPYEKPRDPLRIAAPICCSVVLGEMLVDFAKALNKLGLPYRVVYGTLLGAVRSQAIIPWTYDIDIAIAEALFRNETTWIAIQKELEAQGKHYFVGQSFDMPRAHRHAAPSIKVDTSQFFDGPDDLIGKNGLFSDQIEDSVKKMLPISSFWRTRTYVDFYLGGTRMMESFSLVTINNQQYYTTIYIDKMLTNEYGKNYLTPILSGRWSGLSD